MTAVINGQKTNHVTVNSDKIDLLHLGDRYIVNLKQSPSHETGTYLCVELSSGRQLSCREVPLAAQASLAHLYRIPPHPGITLPEEVFPSQRGFYVLTPKDYGDLHSHVRRKKKLSESESRRIFKQIVEIAHHCHSNSMILSELKLKKIVFLDEKKTRIGLSSLKNSFDCSSCENDAMKEHSGCPAYVCPEMLNKTPYSGVGADMWSLGVILYTLLVGKYPFYSKTPQQLFAKIRTGDYRMPDDVSFAAMSILSSLLQVDPACRLTTTAILEHPWFFFTDDETCARPIASFHTVPKSEDPLM